MDIPGGRALRAVLWGLLVAFPGLVLLAVDIDEMRGHSGAGVPFGLLLAIAVGLGAGGLVGWAVEARKLWWPLALVLLVALFCLEALGAGAAYLVRVVSVGRF